MLSCSNQRLNYFGGGSTLTAILLALAGCANDSGSLDDCDPLVDVICADRFVPQIAVIPNDHTIELVDVGMGPGQTTQRTIRVANIGDTSLDLTRVELRYLPPEGASDGESPAFRMIGPTLPAVIQPLNSSALPQGVDIIVEYTKRYDEGPREATLRLHSSDPFTPTLEILFATAHEAFQ